MIKGPLGSKNLDIPKKDQIELVLTGFFGTSILKKLKMLSMNLGQRADALNVTKGEIRAHVKQFGFPDSYSIQKTESSVDGTCIVERNGAFHLFDNERGVPQNERVFSSYQEALEALSEDMISLYMSLRSKGKSI